MCSLLLASLLDVLSEMVPSVFCFAVCVSNATRITQTALLRHLQTIMSPKSPKSESSPAMSPPGAFSSVPSGSSVLDPDRMLASLQDRVKDGGRGGCCYFPTDFRRNLCTCDQLNVRRESGPQLVSTWAETRANSPCSGFSPSSACASFCSSPCGVASCTV